jgi:two-component system sensor histidine kinase UhpB
LVGGSSTADEVRPDHGRARPGRWSAAIAGSDQGGAGERASADRVSVITYTESLDDGRTMSVNPQVEALLGCTQDEWLADPMRWVDMIHPDDRDRVLEACWEANRSGEPYRAEYRMIAADGRVLWFRDEAELVLGVAGQPLCWQGRMLEITAEMQGR